MNSSVYSIGPFWGVLLVAACLAGLLLLGAGFLMGCTSKGNVKEELEVMGKVQTPPIDAVVPSATETATFALG